LSESANDAAVKRIVSTCKNIRYLKLERTAVTDEIADIIAEMPELRSLDLRHTQITNKGMARLARAKNLESITIDESKIDHKALPYFLSMQKLKSIGDDFHRWTRDDRAALGKRHIALFLDGQSAKPDIMFEAKMGFFDTVLEKGQSSLPVDKRY